MGCLLYIHEFYIQLFSSSKCNMCWETEKQLPVEAYTPRIIEWQWSSWRGHNYWLEIWVAYKNENSPTSRQKHVGKNIQTCHTTFHIQLVKYTYGFWGWIQMQTWASSNVPEIGDGASRVVFFSHKHIICPRIGTGSCLSPYTKHNALVNRVNIRSSKQIFACLSRIAYSGVKGAATKTYKI